MKRYTLLIILALTSMMSRAQITIGGDVYGGGKEGAVNTGNTATVTYYTAEEAATENQNHRVTDANGKEPDAEGYITTYEDGYTELKAGDVKSIAAVNDVKLTSSSDDATSVTITDEAVVRTVFGGGRNGRCYGQTNVSVDGGTIGATKWANTIHGGLFGAGDGASAYVFGKDNNVLIKGGTIYNNVYGGGNQADLMGCSKVTLQNGTFYGNVFGGARMANIYGHAFTLLDGENGPAAGETPLIIPAVYGGNDISGTIALSDNWQWTKKENMDISKIPVALRLSSTLSQNLPVDSTWNAFVCSTYPLEDDGTTPDYDNNNIFVGNLYGGGNGDYGDSYTSVTMTDTPAQEEVTYTATDEEVIAGTKSVGDVKTAAVAATTATFENLTKPDLGKTYLNLTGGTYGYVYGGGNNATVTGNTDIMVWDMHIQDGTPSMASIPYSRVAGMDVLESMFDIDEGKTTATPKYQIDRLFGGNNKATMAISPEWYLAQGAFNNIYSGGNKGDMTAEDGLLLNIGSRSVYANNVYGGCRMADVRPQYQSGLDVGSDVKHISDDTRECLKVEYDADGKYTDLTYSEHKFKENCPARVYITEGHINNVYGGNDISGKVYLGTNVVIAGAISGNVYGGGNGSYAYTDNAELAKDPEYADLYYNGGADGASSIAALNAYRPHVDNTVLNIFGNSDQQPTINDDGSITTKANTAKPVVVTGGVYCGGNSATIEGTDGTPSATFNIGKNVIINAVYLGSNGENMITEDILKTHAGSVNGYDYSSFNLTDKDIFAKYMEGCAVNIKPTVTYDWTDGDDPHTYIGSFYGGGNVGSVTYDKPITIDMPAGLVIYDRVVGGCRAADVDKSSYNAAFEGGVITANTGANASAPKVTINMDSYLEPRELTPTMKSGFFDTAKLYWDVRNYYGLKSGSDEKQSVFVNDAGEEVSYESVPWLPYGANVFGGCYTSGHIAGDVQINVTRDIVSNTMIHHDAAMSASVSTPSNASINWVHLGEYVFAKTMSIYGGGYGEKTYIAGDTHINLSGAARVINVLGGADYGTIGCPKTDMHEAHTGSTHVTVATGMTDYSKVDTGKGVDVQDAHLPYNVTKIYGGAYAGTIYGHTELRLNGGSYQQAYGGSCNADIADYASLYLGATGTANSGYPYVYLYAFGGNDFGGYIGRDGSDNTKTDLLAGNGFGDNIKGYHDFTGYGDKTIRTTRYVEYNSGRVGYQYDASKGAFNDDTGTGNFLSEAGSQRSSIYGGSYGSYDYSMKYVSWDYLKDPSGASLQTDFDPANISTFHYPLMKEYIPTADDVFCTNTYVNVPCASTDASNDVIQRGIFGGGRGMTQTGIVDASQTYVYLHGAKWGARNANLSTDIYGGGYYSIVDNTKVDAESGCTNIIYGGSYGTSAKNLNTAALKDIHYNSTRTEVNMYDGMDNSNMSIFGGGGFAGATDTYVNLYGGMAQNVYGGSYNEGYCETTHVNVPDATNTVTSKASTASVNAIFGGGYGNDVTLPCDEGQTNVTFSSATAYVKGGVIYGGNNAKRAAAHTNVVIYTPVKTSATGTYVSICGAGNGACSVAGFTNVTLNNTAYVNNVYGGGRDGKVFGYYDYINDNASTYYNSHSYAKWKWESTTDGNNTKITINQGATAQNVYGGGYGSDATVAGSTSVYNLGGTVTSNIYGGGYSGNVLYQQAEEKASTTDATVLATITGDYDDQKNNIYTSIFHQGGSVNNIYGGGLDGQVGSEHNMTNYPAETRVEIGKTADLTNFYDGDPIVLRSVYGGGYRGAILGTAKINMNNGHIGYTYDTSTSKYTENLKATADDTHSLLKESGNIFGGGYGEGATTDHTIVNMYDGTIRNSLYGGGEIASIGVAEQSTINMADRTQIPSITVAGSTEVNLYGGLVSANVFGGGRGYAIDAYGNTQTGEVGYSDGYTFGKTRVNIYRGTVGTDATIANGDGNVFGGGNIGYVYGADETVTVTKNDKSYKNVTKSNEDGYYHLTGGSGSGLMSEDCKVVVTPACKALIDGTVNGVSYKKGDIIQCDALDNISVSDDWTNDVFGNLDNQGVVIRNAVFAGGNVSAGSDKVYANTKTVYGNATASIVDCFQKDLITIGADEIGGLYGDGNLTFVDGYRELNITNYGTDYYNLNNDITYAEYQKLNDRERAYFELKYKCTGSYTSTGSDGKTYTLNDKITGTEYAAIPDADKSHWVLSGFCTLYAGRMMNTIQRADFCGVFGSRMVLKGAQDRVPSVVDYTKYTLNRVGELSLNQKTHSGKTNGNYFGIYNVVNYLGALTSDVKFTDIRTTDSPSYPATGNTYKEWKSANLSNRRRNNATSKNKVALASGVWLELVKQTATGDAATDKDVYNIYSYAKDEKIYGPITGIVELDLINAATGEGGGYVYALNEHGEQSASGVVQATLTSSNTDAVSYKQYTYATMDSSTKMETTGNFVNGVKTIVDDCYPYNGVWLSSANPTSKAHYWFVRGEYYVYDQYISAYTGAAQSYAESVNVPLTITAEAQGKLKLLNVQQNLNAYWDDDMYNTLAATDSKYIVSGDPTRIVINGNTYYKNTPISYWDWAHLTSLEQSYFTTNTYVCNVAVNDVTNSKNYTEGQTLSQSEYNTAISNLADKYLVESDIEGTTLKKGDVIAATSEDYTNLSDAQKNQCRLATTCFNVTNAVTSDKGFLLTYDWDNPEAWSDYYIKPDAHTNGDMVLATKKTAAQSSYVLSPTYHCKNGNGTKNIYGQTSYTEGDVVNKQVYDKEPVTEGVSGLATQATFEEAYVATGTCTFTKYGKDYNYVKGSAISKTFYNSLTDEQQANFEVGYTCTETYQVSDDKYYINGDIITQTEYNSLSSEAKTSNFSAAYICTSTGAWGGKLYEGGLNYQALDICSLTDTERSNFVYNLDAFETLIANSTTQSPTDVTAYNTSSTYQGLDNYADRHTGLYAANTSIDYTATYTGSSDITVTLNGASKTISKGTEISREEFESLTNERAHYSAITVKKDDTNDTYYVVNSEFWVGDTWYGVGATVTDEVYKSLAQTNKDKITSFTTTQLERSSTEDKTYYFCKEKYNAVTAITSPTVGTATSVGSEVAVGTVLSADSYNGLVNQQQNFDIDGTVPTETSTLYVDSHVGIDDLNEDKIVTVIYEYNYIETNEAGTAYDNVKERHIINIHVHFESGVPTVGELLTPPAVLPGDAVGLNQPSVSKGAYEILGGGWEIYTNEADAQSHKNGAEYTNNNTKMYWYQNGYQVAYYAKSYLGKTYSNSVPITVANYHRMEEVMANNGDNDGDGTADYMYLDEAAKNTNLRNAKVYIKDADELKGLSDFFTETTSNSSLTNVRNCSNLDFILDGDIDYSGKTWNSIGNETNCFSGNFHGDGHAITGLSSSLFDHFCGDIYNTGVAGSYTTAGIANYLDGKAVNCWTATTGAIPADTYYPIAGNGGGIVTNCYYYDKNAYKSADLPSGWTVSPKSLKSFVDGEVAFNLNSYYLNKRYYDNKTTSGESYQYWPVETIGTSSPALSTAYYPTGYDKYVEIRYGNEDFIYADGTIPVSDNIRKKLASYYPVYPDDYIYFGQKLTYGDVISGTGSHVEYPEAVKRVANADDESLNTKLLDTDIKTANRVYRSPAYYKSKEMSMAYFNKPAAFKDSYTLSTGNIYGATSSVNVYKDLTAIDFTGYHDATYADGKSQTAFYTPWLDYDGITAFATSGITRNLLVYADPTKDATSYGVLETALPEATLTISTEGYRSVAIPTAEGHKAADVKGHLVDKTADGYTASRNHFLVDKEVFNCPISYDFDSSHKMWYQRTPANYVDASQGWEAISLPFTADLVSTPDKGEITHFYSNGSTYTKGYDSGHEYWLRQYTGIAKTEEVDGKTIAYSTFAYPTAIAGTNKVDANVFLWDYYYSHDDGSADNIDKDANGDSYPSADADTYLYYKDSRTYPDYPLYTVAVPYIVGFPGSRYYEFDMSGKFEAQNRSAIDKLDAQVISFVSADGTTINVSDDELKNAAVEAGGYGYVPNYMNDALAKNGAWTLNTTGSSFDLVDTDGQTAVPFRPYFRVTPSGGVKEQTPRYSQIYLTAASLDMGKNETDVNSGNLHIYSKNRRIYIENNTGQDKTMQIVNAAGALIDVVTIKAANSDVIPVNTPGVYLVGRMKLFVK